MENKKAVVGMKRLMRLFRDSSIRTKLICYFVLIILLTTILIASLSGIMYRNEMINEQNSSARQMVCQISNNVDLYIQEMEYVIDSLEDDPRVIAYLSQHQNQNSKNLEDSAYRAVLSASNNHSEM